MSLFESLGNLIEGIGMGIEQIALETDSKFNTWRYDANNTTPMTEKNKAALKRLDLISKGEWDFFNNCPKDTICVKLCEIIDDAITVLSENCTENKKKDAVYRLMSIDEDFINKIPSFIEDAVDNSDSSDPVINYSAVLNVGNFSDTVKFGMKKSKSVLAGKIMELISCINNPDNIEYLVQLKNIAASHPEVKDFISMIKSSPSYSTVNSNPDPALDPSATKTFTDVLNEMQALVEPV